MSNETTLKFHSYNENFFCLPMKLMLQISRNVLYLIEKNKYIFIGFIFLLFKFQEQ